MSDAFRGWGFGHLRSGLTRQQEIQRDDQGHWLREWAMAKWSVDTLFPQAVDRWLRKIGDKPEWK